MATKKLKKMKKAPPIQTNVYEDGTGPSTGTGDKLIGMSKGGVFKPTKVAKSKALPMPVAKKGRPPVVQAKKYSAKPPKMPKFKSPL